MNLNYRVLKEFNFAAVVRNVGEIISIPATIAEKWIEQGCLQEIKPVSELIDQSEKQKGEIINASNPTASSNKGQKN